jgi:uncharacterized membrane protein
LSREQLLDLVAYLLRRPGSSAAEPLAAAVSDAGPRDAAEGAAAGSRSGGPTAFAGFRNWSQGKRVSGAIRRAAAKLSSVSRDLLVSILPAVLALAAGPYVLQHTFQRERELARPILSVEYAFLMRDQQPLPDAVKQLVGAITGNRLYTEFLTARLTDGHLFDLRSVHDIPGSRLSPAMRKKFAEALAAYRQHLEQAQRATAAARQGLDAMPPSELRKLAFLNLEGLPSGSDAELRQRLEEQLEGKGDRLRGALDQVATLQGALTGEATNVRMRLSILNRGATDGLIRHHGEIRYRGDTYVIKRTPAPSSDLSMMAVPVFQTNEASDSIALQSVGKIERDSMAEFWFEFVRKGDAVGSGSELCRPAEELAVTLYDHDKRPIVGRLECNQEGG